MAKKLIGLWSLSDVIKSGDKKALDKATAEIYKVMRSKVNEIKKEEGNITKEQY